MNPVYDQPFSFANGATLRNRIVMAPMTTWSGGDDGRLSPDELAYYEARAGGVGMLITGTTYTVPNGRGFPGQFCGDDDRFIPGLTELAERIKSKGAKAVLQIFHAGRMSYPALTGNDVVSASDVPAERPSAAHPRALADAEIEAIVASFGETTRRAIAAGFDGVEIHGANTYLIQQFFSPHSNRRADRWGGSLEARARFPLAVVDAVLNAVKAHADKEFIVGYRFSPEEIENPGITLDDTLYLVDRLAEKELTYLHVSLGRFDQTSQRDKSDQRIVGQVVHQHLKGRLPLIGVGGVKIADDLPQAFDTGYELVAIGRALVAEPQWVEKARAGEKIVPTISMEKRIEKCVPEKMIEVMKMFFPDAVEG
ncbi:MAG: NADH-dependent flavin oxidoreductase [Burkholderiales bacterium]|jgi:2,4-dienoyl-CoA reductase-like NADH-dependent reductase (Old Yellow Enzyme family)|nr:NADH-dependent flavin oxidoreductase [Burkholderiales bacterium]